MDSSDGLSTTLNEMAKQSGKKLKLVYLPSNKDLDDELLKPLSKFNNI